MKSENLSTPGKSVEIENNGFSKYINFQTWMIEQDIQPNRQQKKWKTHNLRLIKENLHEEHTLSTQESLYSTINGFRNFEMSSIYTNHEKKSIWKCSQFQQL